MKRPLLIGLLALASLVHAEIHAKPRSIAMSQDQIDHLAIKIAPLTASPDVPLLIAPAVVVVPVDREFLVSSPRPGLLRQLRANIGDTVEKSQVLAQIESPELLTLQQQFLTSVSNLRLSELEYQRDRKLAEEGVIAERRWQETQALHASKVAQADEARQMLVMAGMVLSDIDALSKNRKLDSQLSVKSPIRGTVLERLATVGARIEMQAPIYRVADLSELWLEINIPQERVQAVSVGDQFAIEVDDVVGHITLLGKSVDRVSQTVLARAVITRNDQRLRVGQHVSVQILQRKSQPGFRVPNSAIAQQAGRHYVFVRTPTGFDVVDVTVVGKYDQEALIRGELTGREQLAITGAVSLKANWLNAAGEE